MRRGPAKTCPECGAAITVRTRRIHCSKPCSFAAKRRATREELGTKTCAWVPCGAEFGPTENQRRHPKRWAERVYCSRECAVGDRTRESPGSLRSALVRMGTKACAVPGCGIRFGPTEWDRRHPKQWAERKYCSRRCAGKSSPAPPPRRPLHLPRGPAPEVSVFGDRKPAETWRPAGFSATSRSA